VKVVEELIWGLEGICFAGAMRISGMQPQRSAGSNSCYYVKCKLLLPLICYEICLLAVCCCCSSVPTGKSSSSMHVGC
jgi:hypothetical protein